MTKPETDALNAAWAASEEIGEAKGEQVIELMPRLFEAFTKCVIALNLSNRIELNETPSNTHRGTRHYFYYWIRNANHSVMNTTTKTHRPPHERSRPTLIRQETRTAKIDTT